MYSTIITILQQVKNAKNIIVIVIINICCGVVFVRLSVTHDRVLYQKH